MTSSGGGGGVRGLMTFYDKGGGGVKNGLKSVILLLYGHEPSGEPS